ncbi:MAG: hypothetical protein LBK95_12045 [Bifidobacteriaceae bacterium]|nr:hypothetical protein [Bifidobacteriaceae bacterium]
MSMMFNESDEESQADTVTLIDAKLIGSVGLELVDAFTVSTDAQIAVGKAVPPSDQDFEGDPEFSREQVENWAMRKPLAGSVILAEGVLQLVRVLRPTSEDTCLFAPGFNLRYEEFGRTYSVDSGLGMVVYRGEDPDICDSAVDEIRNNPVYR